ncbi:SDR family NAD(P)-dependent oxidoreductase [Pelagicoccus mobilis]|uniref:SDR family oxidoreductase n=1 Tax=Pelagicoccus mobilis TaxID=415221 RepID=A0A934S629_9BACT|nr:SDR family oxidoreductase [Pelagicoccus mobilis]MBK1880059.1 SDR family oxidoreductase [Pelagicoccus mobilis]
MANYAIIGAAGAIGSALTSRLTDQGHNVFAGVRDLSTAAGLTESQQVKAAEIDATDWDAYAPFFKGMEAEFGSIDGLAICVGSILLKPAHLTKQADYQQVISSNLTPCFAALHSVARRMMKTGGSIAFCSSAAARHGYPNHEAIAAAKAGIIGLTLSAAATYATYGIRVNCVAPGLVDSKMAQPIVQNEPSLKASQNMHALGRIGNPKEVASALSWLLDPEQTWVTGQVLGVDGGLATVHSKRA